jgi:hypothetical protein
MTPSARARTVSLTENSHARRPGLALPILGALLVACGGGGPTSPSRDALPRQGETPAFVFFHVPGDVVDMAWQQAYHEWAVRALDVVVGRQIAYNKYLSRTAMGNVTGNYNTNGFAEPGAFAIHTLWSRDNHEVVHVYSSLFGSPVALLNEGLAVAFQTDPVAGDLTPRWSGRPVHDLARDFLRQGRLIAIDSLLTSAEFRRFDPDVTYPLAGSFMTHVLDTYGLAAVKRLFQAGQPLDTADSVRRQVADALGRSVSQIEQDWRAMLDAR